MIGNTLKVCLEEIDSRPSPARWLVACAVPDGAEDTGRPLEALWRGGC